MNPISDDKYLKAVESGNIAVAQIMVDTAATRSGFTHEVFRSNETPVNLFDTKTRSAWFTECKDDAEEYGFGPISRYFINPKNYASVDDILIRERLADIVTDGDFDDLVAVSEAMPLIRERPVSEFDGIRTESFGSGEKVDHFNPFHPWLIRSAEAVVYDEFGAIVPPSIRFDPTSRSPDIRGLPVPSTV